MSKVIITKYEHLILVALFLDGVMEEIGLFDPYKATVGDVYLCRIRDKLPGINACFINYSSDKKGFFKNSSFKSEDIIPLQFKSDSKGKKEPVFTDNIQLNTGLFIVTKGQDELHVSTKIDDTYRREISNDLREVIADKGIKVIVRTLAANLSIEELKYELEKTIEEYGSIFEKAKTRTLYSKLYSNEKEYISFIKELLIHNPSELLTDDEDIFKEISSSLSDFINKVLNGCQIKKYDDDFSLLSLYKIRHNVDEITRRNVLLKSGAELVFDYTEALTVIDINTSKCSKYKDAESTFFNINMEAAEEIMRQIRLRNISGIIIVDFINMKSTEHYQILLDRIKELIKNDSVLINNISLTNLKLVEMTRQKKRLPVSEQMR